MPSLGHPMKSWITVSDHPPPESGESSKTVPLLFDPPPALVLALRSVLTRPGALSVTRALAGATRRCNNGCPSFAAPDRSNVETRLERVSDDQRGTNTCNKRLESHSFEEPLR